MEGGKEQGEIQNNRTIRSWGDRLHSEFCVGGSVHGGLGGCFVLDALARLKYFGYSF